MTSQPTTDDLHHTGRIPVPSGVFAAGGQPRFVLFDRWGKRVRPDEAPVVYVSPGDVDALYHYALIRMRKLTTDTSLPAVERGWILYRGLLRYTAEAFAAARSSGHHGGIDAGARTLAMVAREDPAIVLEHGDAIGEYSLITHAVETALFATALAVADGVDDEDRLTELAIAGLYADAGKLQLPESLLNHDGTLTEEQWERMREHPRESVAILGRFSLAPEPVIRAVLAHHERWDGSGYPRGLAGSEIPIEGQYLGIADSFTALTAHRTFADGRGAFAALQEMSDRSGQFEPGLLRTFVQLVGRSLHDGRS